MQSDQWKEEALRRFPELGERAGDWETPYLLWFDLQTAFERAYKTDPRDEQMIARIYDFSDWCLAQPQGRTAVDDLSTCVAVCFFEHIPETAEALADMPRWFSREDILKMKDIFSYHAGEEGFAAILNTFDNYRETVLKKFPAKKRREPE